MRFFVTEPSNIWGISCEKFSWCLSNKATGQTFYIQGRSTVEELQEMLNNRIELVEALQWAVDELVATTPPNRFDASKLLPSIAALAKAQGAKP
jgi:hypothetical protein